MRRETKTGTKSKSEKEELVRQLKLEIKTKSVELIPSACNKCGLMRPTVDKRGRPRRYLNGHAPRLAPREEKHHKWKGENVSYMGLHQWVRPRLPKPTDGACQLCHRTDLPLELACVGEYSRLGNLKDNWKCRSCNIADPRREKKWRETMLERYTRAEINAKISKALLTPEVRAKLSQLNNGQNNPMFGKRLSEGTKTKISQANSGPKNPMFGPPYGTTKIPTTHKFDILVLQSITQVSSDLG